MILLLGILLARFPFELSYGGIMRARKALRKIKIVNLFLAGGLA